MGWVKKMGATSRARRAVALAYVVLALVVGLHAQSQRTAAGQAVGASPESGSGAAKAFVAQYCVSCHSKRLRTAGLVLEGVDPAQSAERPDIWERVIRKVSLDAMPPPQARQPEPTDRNRFVAALKSDLDTAYLAARNPGRALVHRLNRAEYGNAIRDLLGIEIDVADLLPPDSASYGFDNISDALMVSPILLSRYLAAAEKISQIAVGDPDMGSEELTLTPATDLSQNQPAPGMPPGTMGGVSVTHYFPLDAEYALRGRLWEVLGGGVRGMGGEVNPYFFEIAIDGRRVLLAPIGGKDDNDINYADPSRAIDVVNRRLQVRVPIKAGPHKVTFGFLRTLASTQEHLHPFERASVGPEQAYGAPKLKWAYITGPFDGRVSTDTPSRRRIFICRPAAPADEEPCAAPILSNLALRAYARRPTAVEMEELLGFFRHGRAMGSFDRGIQMALPRILTGPEFLFRSQPEPVDLANGSTYQVSDAELATRLALFLWSSIPDKTLIDLALAGRLRRPGILEAQVRRMLADPRSKALVTNFAGQWLYLRNLDSLFPDIYEFPDFDDNLRQSFKDETLLLFDSIVREDRSVLTLFSADYTFVNERLAKYYGIPNIYGPRLRRVPVTDPNRRGLLGQGSFLTVTSIANRTAPTIRGKWILTELLGVPPPPPPPDLSNSLAKDEGGGKQPLRKILERHRNNPVCAGCHRVMDPIGLAFENFDGAGKWRTTDEGQPIDASAVLFNNAKVDGPASLRVELLRYRDVIAETFTQKLMTYALGRGIEPEDFPAVRIAVRAAARDDYRFSSIVANIVQSIPFQMKVKRSASERRASHD